MEHWHLPSLTSSGKRNPGVLLSTRECRAVVIDLAPGEELGEHQVHERALVQVVAGTVRLSADGREVTAGEGTFAAFAPGERHGLRAEGPARVLLLLAPWPGSGHYADGESTPDPAYVAPG